MSDWRDISTAPKDGTWILATQDFCEFYRARWMTRDDLAKEYGGRPADWVEACWDDGGNACRPQYWQPTNHTAAGAIANSCPKCTKLAEEVDRLKGWLLKIDGGDNPCRDETTLRQWAYNAVTLGHQAP